MVHNIFHPISRKIKTCTARLASVFKFGRMNHRLWRSDFKGHFSFSPTAPKKFGRTVSLQIGGAHPRALSPRRCQSGRTLLEMLAVLAIVGVLSIAALAGFMYAMNKIRANDTMRDVNLWALRATETEQTYQTGQTIPTDDIGYKSTHGYDIAAVAAGNNLFAVELFGLSDKVCRLLLEMAASSYVVEATHDGMGNGVQFDGNDTSVCANEPTLYFYFDSNMNKPTDVCLPACGVGETCCNNGCYPTDGLCGSLCACPTGTECKGDGLCCLPESEPCNGTCCPASQICTNGSCSCPQGATINEEGQCVCPSGSMLVDNKCQSVICTGSGSNYTCTDINGNRCGTGCNEDGSTCWTGHCQNYCPKGTVYRYIPSLNYYGCVNPDTGVYCYFINGNTYTCYLEDKCGSQCPADGQNCSVGDCQNLCPVNDSKGNPITWDYYNRTTTYACFNENTDMTCYKAYNRIECYKNDIYCGFCDLSGENCTINTCSECKDNQEKVCPADNPSCTESEKVCPETNCPDGTTWTQKGNNYVCERPDGFYCYPIEKVYWRCLSPDDQICGRCYEGTGHSCQFGLCENTCPDHLTYAYAGSAAMTYGCYDSVTGVTCYPYESWYNCTKNNQQCGTRCTDYYATGCPLCLSDATCPSGTYINDAKDQCTNSQTDVVCNILGTDARACKKDGFYCGSGCNLDGTNCTTGLCTDSCPTGTKWNSVPTAGYYGCVSTSSPTIACYKQGSQYICYKDWVQCGTTCTDYTGAGCSGCQVDETVDCPDGTQYQPTTGLCASPDSTTGCVENNGSWECVTCATGSSYGDLGNGRYGCINDNGTKCYADGDSFTCLKDGVICGTGCSQTGTGGTCDAGCG